MAALGLNYKIKSHCTILLKKTTSKHAYTHQNANNIKIFKKQSYCTIDII